MASDRVDNKVIVKIYGEDYPIAGAEDPAYISRIADLVDSRMKDVASQSRIKSADKVAILTALSFASELYEKEDTTKGSTKAFDASVDQLISRLDLALEGTI